MCVPSGITEGSTATIPGPVGSPVAVRPWSVYPVASTVSVRPPAAGAGAGAEASEPPGSPGTPREATLPAAALWAVSVALFT